MKAYGDEIEVQMQRYYASLSLKQEYVEAGHPVVNMNTQKKNL